MGWESASSDPHKLGFIPELISCQYPATLSLDGLKPLGTGSSSIQSVPFASVLQSERHGHLLEATSACYIWF
jgi:hypothetical protein